MTTEEKILKAAREVFQQYGYGRARMQDVADKAGINKALLHYYFDSKDKLFQAVFTAAIMELMPAMMGILNSDMPLFDKIEAFVRGHIDNISRNPGMPGFVMSELSQNPERLLGVIRGAGMRPSRFFEQIEAAVAAGEIRPIKPIDLVANMTGMTLWPFVGRPMISMLSGMNDKEYDAFLEARKTTVVEFIINALRP